MTGNTKVWRAPLAGLASLAMLATMGVAATTANAATVDGSRSTAPTVGVTINGASVSGVKLGESYADVIADNNYQGDALKQSLLHGSASATTFGGLLVNGKPASAAGQVKDGDAITFADYADGVQLHFKTNSVNGTALDLGYVRVPLVKDGENQNHAQVNVGQLPYDVADGIKLDLSKVTVSDNGKAGDLSKGGTITFNGTPTNPVDVTVGATSAKKVSFKASPRTDTSIVYPGAIADGSATSAAAKANYTVDVATDGTFDPQQVLDGAYVYTIGNVTLKDFKDDVTGDVFTATTQVKQDTFLTPEFANVHVVQFKVNGKVVDSLTQYVSDGNKVKQPADQTSTNGSVWTGWFVDTDGNGVKDADESDFNFDTALDSSTPNTLVLTAGWANGGSHTLTYKYADDKTADKTETYLAKQNTARPADPTRDGYLFDGWYEDKNGDGVLDTTESASRFKFGEPLTADTTLIARWLQANDATLEAALKYVNGSDESNNDKGLFTKASFKAYVATYQDVQKRYAQAKNEATAKGEQIPADTFNTLLNDLVAGWKKLEFIHTGDSNSWNIVHRLSKGNDHFYTQDGLELKGLTNNNYTGAWNDEGELFQTVPKAEGSSAFANALNSLFGVDTLDAAYQHLQSFDSVATGDAKTTLDAVADPILTPVTRLYNRVNGDHVWTVDQNEADYLSAQPEWNNEAEAFYVPRYTGSQPVTRLAKGNRHLLSTDANEVKVLTADGWGNEGVAFKAY